MKKDLKDYIVQIPLLDKEFCNQTIDELVKVEELKGGWEQHKFYNAKTGVSKPRSGNFELDILYTNQIDNTKVIMKKLWNGIDNYIKTFNFPWFDGWKGYSAIRYNRYFESRKMALHCDHIHSMFDGNKKGVPILSCLGVLNDNYEGGEFIIFDDYEIKFKQGDLLIFPSNFLYPHKVEPVTKGTRYSYISWVW